MKRKHDSIEINFTVIETIEDESAYVQFMPHFWLVPTKGSELKERDVVKFYFPRRLPKQSKDSYWKFVKHAKFIHMEPQNDGKWELRDGRILKMGLGSLEDAINAEKLFSDYFSTTEAEMELLPPEPKRCVRKKKKVASKVASDSESDTEVRVSEVTKVSNYNDRFAHESRGTESQGTCSLLGQVGNIMPISLMELDQLMEESMCGFENQVHPTGNALNSEGMDETSLDLSNEMFVTLNVPIVNGKTYAPPEGSALNIPIVNGSTHALPEGSEIIDEESADDVNEQQNGCVQNSCCCKGHRKIMNKIDYVHKKFSNEFSSLRHEMLATRKLLSKLLPPQREANADNEDGQDEQPENVEPAPVDVIEIDAFNEKYKALFPIQDSNVLIDFNQSMKDDQKFVDSLFSKLSQIKAENETKTARKLLKEMCDFRCLKDFTWLGTKKTKSFQELHLVLELVTQLINTRYPDCDAMSILVKVVQQRTKSAKEAWAHFLEKGNASSAAAHSVQVNENHSTITDPVIVTLTEKTDDNNADNDSDPKESC